MIDLETFKTKLSNEISLIPKRGGRKYKHYTEYKVQLKQHTLYWIKKCVCTHGTLSGLKFASPHMSTPETLD